ncbi:MAG: TIGR03936 family radical SAM-associated protein, partial [Candidatus Omnitrophica bacterium]|nr:TIGR03936 family radical SAM-associated protein [Candidatus Omnitrophota bacterium]
YQKKGPLRFISHLDLERFWRRAVRRALIPVVISAGFSPKERIEMGYPLPVGCESEGEDLILETLDSLPISEVAERLSANLPEVAERLSANLPEGITLVSVLPYLEKGSLFHRTSGLSYRVEGLSQEKRVRLPVESGRSPKLWEYLSREFNLSPEEVKLLKVTRIGVQYSSDSSSCI